MAGTALMDGFAAMAERVGTAIVETDQQSLLRALQSLVDASRYLSVGVAQEVAELFPNLISLRRGTESWPEIHVGLARLAVAATGTLVIAEQEHRDRLAALLCVHHVVVLPSHAIVSSPIDAALQLRGWMETGDGRYVTFVTGPSRTSDIERVLTVGVHGPRQLTAVLVHGWTEDAA